MYQKRKSRKAAKAAKDVHYEVVKKVRKTIADIGGIMPEKIPTPEKSLKELERENKEKNYDKGVTKNRYQLIDYN